MFLKSLDEDIKGKVTNNTKHKNLYHLTDGHGFAFTVSRNMLKSLRYSYISTTYDHNRNFILGGNHYYFKFILDGPALAKQYGVFKYDAYTTEIDVNNRKRSVSLNEKEIGINTNEIEPFNKYCKGMQILVDLFSQTAIQWLMYNNNDRKPMFDVSKSASPRAIETLYTFMNDWGLPVYNNKNSPLNSKELDFLEKVYAIHKSPYGNFRKAMRRLVIDYPIVDHFGKEMDRATVLRIQLGDSINDIFNKYFQNRKIKDTDPEEVKQIVIKCMKIMRFNSNIINTIVSHAESKNLFHPTTPVIEWSIVFSDLAYGDINGALSSIDYVSNRNKHNRDYWDSSDDDVKKYASPHSGTMFRSMSNR